MATKIPPELQKLTQKQRDFVLHYVTEKNGTKAAKMAGYKGGDTVLGVAANKLLKIGKIQAAINALNAPAFEMAQVSIETVIKELAGIGFAGWEKFEYYDKYGNLRHALGDKTQALKLLGDHVGAFKNAAGDADAAPRLQIVREMSEDDARKYLLGLLRRK